MPQIQEYPELTNPAYGDVIPIVHDPFGSPVVKRIPIENLLNRYSVSWFGAVGNGVANDTAAIQAAIDAAATAGGIVFFPSGIWLLKADIYQGIAVLIDHAKITLQGVGVSSIIRSHPDSENEMTLIKITADDVTVDNLCFDSSIIYGSVGILIDGCDRPKVRNCHFIVPSCGIVAKDNIHDLLVVGNTCDGDGTFFAGSHPSGSSRWNISNNVCHGDLTGTYGGMGITIDAPTAGFSDAVIANNVISDCKVVVYNGGLGIALARCSHVVVSGNYVSGCEWGGIHVEDRSSDILIVGNDSSNNNWSGIGIQPVAAGGCDNILVSGNTVKNNCLSPSLGLGLGGIEVGHAVNDNHNITISNNQCIDNSGYGVYCKNTYSTIITGNFCIGNTEGIYGYGVPKCLISGNVCKNSTTGAGIHLETFTAGLIIANQCFDDQTPKTQTYGLHTEGNSDGARAENNSFLNNLSGAIHDVSTALLPGITMPWLWGAATLGNVTGKIQIFDQLGNSLGWVPVYDAIT